jgi:hypothetical protein
MNPDMTSNRMSLDKGEKRKKIYNKKSNFNYDNGLFCDGFASLDYSILSKLLFP